MIRHILISTTSTAKLLCNCGTISQSSHTASKLSLPVQHWLNSNAPFSTSVVSTIQDHGDKKRMPAEDSFANLYADRTAKAPAVKDDEIQGLLDSGVLIPTAETPYMMIGGVRYMDLPVAHIKASYQNTIITITDASGSKFLAQSSGGTVGFKNAAKRGTVPAQRAGYTIGQNVRREGLKNIRVLIQGIGQGRFASIHGLKLSGLNIISITDKTCDELGRRPRRRPHK